METSIPIGQSIMARVGQNPLKWIEIVDKPKKITIVTVTHIPELNGFWENSLNTLKIFFDSLEKSTKQDYDLMVLDNGSCKIVKEYLLNKQSDGFIQYLTFSNYNLRKLGAMNLLFGAAPGEIISFADSDVYFLDGWLDETLKIMTEFPEAGMVSALPTIDKSKDYYSSTSQGINHDYSIQVCEGDNIIPMNYIDAHRNSIGKTKREYFQNVGERVDTFISRNNVNAYVCAQDFQFTTKREIIQKVLPLNIRSNEEYYDPIYSPVFEAKVNEAGYWRLSTKNYLIHHIGNDSSKLDEELSLLGDNRIHEKGSQNKFQQRKKNNIKNRILEHPIFRSILKKVYSKIYNWLYVK